MPIITIPRRKNKTKFKVKFIDLIFDICAPDVRRQPKWPLCGLALPSLCWSGLWTTLEWSLGEDCEVSRYIYTLPREVPCPWSDSTEGQCPAGMEFGPDPREDSAESPQMIPASLVE